VWALIATNICHASVRVLLAELIESDIGHIVKWHQIFDEHGMRSAGGTMASTREAVTTWHESSRRCLVVNKRVVSNSRRGIALVSRITLGRPRRLEVDTARIVQGAREDLPTLLGRSIRYDGR
jgi:hypothetical protein